MIKLHSLIFLQVERGNSSALKRGTELFEIQNCERQATELAWQKYFRGAIRDEAATVKASLDSWPKL